MIIGEAIGGNVVGNPIYEHFIDPKTNPLARLWGDDTTDTDAAAEAANDEFNAWVEEQYIQEQLNGKITDGTCGGGD